MQSDLHQLGALAARTIEAAPTAVAFGVRWLVLFVVFCGMGASLRALCCRGAAHGEHAWLDFWNGWAVVAIVLQLWHLWRPIDGGAVAAIAVLALPGMAIRSLEAYRARVVAPGSILAALAVAAATPWLAIVLSGEITNYDTGLYHLQSVMWISSHPIVPGLGNLHDRLALNSAFHLYAALLDALPWGVPSFRLANGLPWLVLLAQLVRLASVPTRSGWDRARRLFVLLLLVPILRQPATSLFDGLSPDFAVFAVQVPMAIALFSVLAKSRRSGCSFDLLSVVVLAAFSITLKLNAVAVSTVAAAICGYAELSKSSPFGWRDARNAAVAGAAVSIALIVPWIARAIILSGYPLYPAAVLAMPVEWRIPRPLVLDMGQWITSWARTPQAHWSDVLGNAAWILPWVARNSSELRLPVAGTALGALLAVGASHRGQFPDGRPILYLAPWLAGLALWFSTAPDPRFALGPIWITYAAVLSFGWHAASRHPSMAIAARLAVPVGLVLVAVALPLRTMARRLLIPAAAPIPVIETSTYTTASGLRVLSTVHSDTCWGAPLPCTPYPRPSLRSRRPGDLASGFVLDDPLGCIDLHHCGPDVVRAPHDVGVDLPERLWPDGGPVDGRIRLHAKGGIVLYVDSARAVRLTLHADEIESPAQRVQIEARLDHTPLGRQPLAPGVAVEFTADLRPGFNVLSLHLADDTRAGETIAVFSLVEIIDRP